LTPASGGDLMVTRASFIMAQQPRLARTRRHASLVLGDPDLTWRNAHVADERDKLRPLSGARDEATRVASHLGTKAELGPDASLATLRAQGTDVPILHVAAHGFTDPGDPARSFVVLADGHLTAQALYASGFGFGSDTGYQAGLVMLSACQTARGALHPDSVINLANGFLVAGANTVVSTLWSIDDKSSRRLVDKFYQLLAPGQGNESGWSAAGALRAAQLERLRDADDSHPFFWAAFKLTGNARNPLAPGLAGG
jgi:CHAT domain-containing protein